VSASGDLHVSKDFEYLTSFLPPGWEAKAKELGALRRCRGIADPGILLRVLLVHLAEGCSLRETATRAREGGLADVSDVAVMDRLRQAGEWFSWMSRALMARWTDEPPGRVLGGRWNVRLVDATRVREPGPTGSSWCVHYAIDLPGLRCREMLVQDKHGNGETFQKFEVVPGDLLLGDRVYGTIPSIAHVLAAGGDVLVRMAWNLLPLHSADGTRFDLFGKLRGLEGTEVGDWDVVLRQGERAWAGRVCAVRKSRQATDRARQALKRVARKHGTKVQPETWEAAAYVFAFTSIPRREGMTATAVLGMYRGRWQVELVFKRLKSLMGLGHLRKKDPAGAKAWLQGKLLVAFLVEALIAKGQALSPWGYLLRHEEGAEPVPLEGGGLHAPPPPDGRQSRAEPS
jgi:hypothetical protein